MSHYRPDHEDIKGREALEKLRGKNAKAIRYHVSKKDDRMNRLEKTIEDMYKVFEGIKKYTR